jgi:hypothetical protein
VHHDTLVRRARERSSSSIDVVGFRIVATVGNGGVVAGRRPDKARTATVIVIAGRLPSRAACVVSGVSLPFSNHC